MQAMSMLNQHAVVSEASVSRSMRSGGVKSEGGFLPALQGACNESCDNELAGAAMAVQNGRSQENLAGSGDAPSWQVAHGQAVMSGVTDQIAANVAGVVEGAVEGVAVPVAAVAEKAAPAQIVPDLAVELDLEVGQGEKTAHLSPDAVSATSEKSLNMAAHRGQAVADFVVQNSASFKGGAPVVSSELEQVLRQFNVLPLNKNLEQAAGEKQATKGGSGNNAIVTDPRFATLLNRPEIGESLRQQQNNASVTASMSSTAAITVGNEGSSGAPSAVTAKGDLSSAPTADLLNSSATLGTSLTLNQNGAETVSTALQPEVAKPDATVASKAEVALPLRDGSSIPESRVVQQTIDHLTLHARADSSTVTVKLHPEELGELQLRMVMEGDQLKVHLQAQSQQVQEVLERNFPRLRDALQEQGVTVEDFQVSVDAGERGDQQFSEQREFVASGQRDHFSSHDQVDAVDEVAVAVGSPINGRSVSLRV